ncbi:hypothetical protein LXL04_037640 [Taraxacum kok-saghyz]
MRTDFRLFLPYVFRRTKSATIKKPLPSSSCVFFLRRLKYTVVSVLPPLQRRLATAAVLPSSPYCGRCEGNSVASKCRCP